MGVSNKMQVNFKSTSFVIMTGSGSESGSESDHFEENGKFYLYISLGAAGLFLLSTIILIITLIALLIRRSRKQQSSHPNRQGTELTSQELNGNDIIICLANNNYQLLQIHSLNMTWKALGFLYLLLISQDGPTHHHT